VLNAQDFITPILRFGFKLVGLMLLLLEKPILPRRITV
jgi:hypothetical protein